VSPRLDQGHRNGRQIRFRERECDFISSVSETDSNKPSFPQSERGGGYVFENEQESQEGKTKLVCKSRTHIEWADKKRPVKEKNALQK